MQLNLHQPTRAPPSVLPEAATDKWTASSEALGGLNIGRTDDGSASGSVPSTGPNGIDSPIPFTSSSDTSILPIVTNQRDRFRARNAELEEVRFRKYNISLLLLMTTPVIHLQELRKQFQTVSDLRTDVRSLQQDNLKLYEKVRYMQSYREESSAGPSGSVQGPSNATPLGAASGGANARADEVGSRYKSMYEERMNPFEAFRGRVRKTISSTPSACV